MKLPELKKSIEWLRKNPFVPLIFLVGMVLLMLPSGGESTEPASTQVEEDIAVPKFSLEAEEERLESVLKSISGVGDARVLLSLRSTATRNLADSSGEAIVVSTGSGKQQVVESGFEYPSYLGAVVVCQGADDAYVRLSVTDAVAAFTGLGTGDIQVLKMD
ncbi:MAG: stage III sporulation protein AG [Oscillospiraceae bacterium]